MTDSEQKLVDGMRAFAELYQDVEMTLKQAAIRMLRDAHEVAEFMQDCCAALLVEARGFDPLKASFADWAERMVINRCRKRRIQLDAEIPFSDIEDCACQEDCIQVVEDRVDYEMAVLKLPPMQKKCWTMKQEGYANREIARSIGIRPGAVAENVRKAKEKIRNQME